VLLLQYNAGMRILGVVIGMATAIWLSGCASNELREAVATVTATAAGVPATVGVPSTRTPAATVTEVLEEAGSELVWVAVPAGAFVMGANGTEALAACQASRLDCTAEDVADEGPARMVYLDEFEILQTEVTNDQYRQCVAAGACSPPTLGEFYNDERFGDDPVVYVDWYQAAAFCTWAGGALPTEAQWEKAARGTDGRTYPWGEESGCGYANIAGCTQGLTLPVGSFLAGASPYGAVDMAGNAGEWVRDWYDPGFYESGVDENPLGPEAGELKAARGGSWKNLLAGVRVTNRQANLPEVFSSGTGFRCVIEP
jgi:formylglycine-generating enzyme required for sulfatase activity